MSSKWTAADVPDQSGRVAIVTGANTGIGYEAAAVLADKGAHVVLAVRNLDKGNDAADRIKAKSPNAVVAVQELDLTSLDNIRKAADELRASHPRIDLLINNAGVMYMPTRRDHQGRLRDCSSAPTTSATSRSPVSCSTTCCRSKGRGW